MKTIVLMYLLLPLPLMAQVWQENFNGLANGTTSDADASAWTTTLPTGGAASFSKQTPVAGYELFLVDNTGTEGKWESAVIDISAHAEVALEVTLYSNFTFASDYIRCYYKIDGNAEVLFGELLGNNGLNITSAASAIVSGSTLQIVVRGMDNTGGTTTGIINALAFDNITVSSISVLYSRQSGNWSNTSSWSTTGFGGVSCACIPGTNARVVIGNNNSISIPGASTAAGITVAATGRLQFTGSTTLTLARGGTITVDEGGILNNNGGNGNITFGTYSYNVIVHGVLATTTFTTNAGSSVAFSGNGSVSVTDLLVNSGSGQNITLNVAGGFSITNDLRFQATSSNTALTNHRNLTVGNRLLFSSSNVTVTNQGTISAGSIVASASTNNGNIITNNASGTLNVGAINLNSGNFDLNNYGTTNQTGNFSNVDAGSNFRNQAGGVWNFSGGGTNTRLLCNNGVNTFNYTASGGQSILVPADAYSNLGIAGSGVKTMTGNLDINGDLNITGTAQLDVSATPFNIQLAGNWSATSAHANPFIERTGTLTFDGTTDQSIAAGGGTENFYNLAVNKTSGNVIQSASPATKLVVANQLNLTNGALSVNGQSVEIASTSASAITRTNGCIISETTAPPYSSVKWNVGTATGAFIFPFGKTRAAADYVPFTFNITTGGTGAGSVSVITYATGAMNTPWPETVMHLNNASGGDNSHNVADRFWFITLDNYTANPTTTVTFTATPAEVGSIGSLRAQRWNSVTGKWDAPKPGQTNSTLYSVTVPAVDSFSPWALSGNNVVLPVQLISFNAWTDQDVVKIKWQTASEKNSASYTVQRSADLENYDAVETIDAHGTSAATHRYEAVDKRPINGISYYRLKQSDIDGNVQYFKPVKVEYYIPDKRAALYTYPVPSNGHEFTISLSGLNVQGAVTVTIVNVYGQPVFATSLLIDASGRAEQKLSIQQPLAPGIYTAKAGYLITRIVVE